MSNATFHEVDRYVRHLHDTGAKHRKGFKLKDLDCCEIADHLNAELDELLEARTHCEALDEAGDVLGCALHLFYAKGLPIDDVISAAMNKLRLRFETGVGP